jgi:hypothetical protein
VIGSSDANSGFRPSDPPHSSVAHIAEPVVPPAELRPAPPRADEIVHRVPVTRAVIAPPIPAPDDIVARINASYMPSLSHCYRKAQRDNPGISGRVSLTFAVDQDGRLLDVNASGVDDALDHCIATLMSYWHFEAPSTHGEAAQLFSMSLALQAQ